MVVSRSRCFAVWVTATLAAATTGGWAWSDLRGSQGTGSFADLLAALAALVLVACAIWGWVVTTVVVASAVRDHRRAAGWRPVRAVPRAAQRLVLLACGVALVGVGQVAPAQAGHAPVLASDHPGDPDGSERGIRALTGLPLPDRPTGARSDGRRREPTSGASGTGAAIAAVGRAVTAAAPDTTVVVAPGDSLWSIAEDLLAPTATPADVARLVGRLHDANRAVIGADPDLILPGHQLRTPLGERPTR